MIHLSPAAPGTLRERFVADMTVRGFTDKTRKDYIRTVAGFAAFLERSPSTANRRVAATTPRMVDSACRDGTHFRKMFHTAEQQSLGCFASAWTKPSPKVCS